MSLLEWIGLLAIIVFFAKWATNIIKLLCPFKFSKDPAYDKGEFEFKRMSEAFEKLVELRDFKADTDNQVIESTQIHIERVIQSTVPLPKGALASDYRSKRVCYEVIHKLGSHIILGGISKDQM